MNLNLGETLRQSWTNTLARWLPDRTKRLILFSSISALIRQDEQLDSATMKKLNSVMRLCESENAMQLGATLKHVIWGDRVVAEVKQTLRGKEKLSDTSMRRIVDELKTATPSWLCYAESKMESDLIALMQHRPEILN